MAFASGVGGKKGGKGGVVVFKVEVVSGVLVSVEVFLMGDFIMEGSVVVLFVKLG